MDPKVPDDREGDLDSDLLSNLREMILDTDPSNADTDGDGVTDGEEVDNGGDPNNPADRGQRPPGKDEISALVELTGTKTPARKKNIKTFDLLSG